MAKYRKKPVVIEAIEWTGDNHDEISNFIGVAEDPSKSVHAFGVNEISGKPIVLIKTLEGMHEANVGDMIIKGVKGEFYPCKPEIFKLTYDPVREIQHVGDYTRSK